MDHHDLAFDPTEAELRLRHGTKWVRYGPDVIPAWVADMDFAPAPVVRARLQAALDRGDLGYPSLPARSGVAAAVAGWFARRHGLTVEPDFVDGVGDVVTGIARCLHALTQPGDGVLVTSPVYPPFWKVIPDNGRRVVAVPLTAQGRLDLDAIDAAMRAERPAAILLCSPHNPTGVVHDRSELDRLAALAREHGAAIVSDEIHADLTFAPHRFVPMGAVAPERTVTVWSASKAFNLAGLRCAFTIAHDEATHARLVAQPEDHGTSILGVEAALGALTDEGEAWLGGLHARLASNLDLVEARLAHRFPHRRPEGTYLVWLAAHHLGPDPARRVLEEAKVALSIGADFGPGGEHHVRLNVATGPGLLATICERLVGLGG